MSPKSRAALIITGTIILFLAFLLWNILSFAPASLLVPPLSFSPKAAYLLYLRAVGWLLGPTSLSQVIAECFLVLLISLWVFRVGWHLVRGRHPLLSATMSLIFFLLNPVVLSWFLLKGRHESLFVPLFLIFFVWSWLVMENWSTFMRSICLAFLWSAILWADIPSALWVPVALLPWVIWNRRPLPAFGLWLTLCLLGGIFFMGSWGVACLVLKHLSAWKQPLQEIHDLLTNGLRFSRDAWISISPFWCVLGLWAIGRRWIHMLKVRRAGAVDFLALLASVVFLTSEMYPATFFALWSPLIARRLTKSIHFDQRGVRITLLIGFIVGAIMEGFWMKTSFGSPELILWNYGGVMVGVMMAAGVTRAIQRTRSVAFQEGLPAILAGATAASFTVRDLFLFRQ